MKTVQTPISDNHQSAMFFDGVVATGTKDGVNYTLKTYQDGEISYKDKLYVGSEIRDLGATGAINDDDIEAEDSVDVYVDRFFVITAEGAEVNDENEVENDYEEAIEAFENFLNKN